MYPIQNGNLGSWYFEYHDKMLLKRNYAEKGIQFQNAVIARYGAYISIGSNFDA